MKDWWYYRLWWTHRRMTWARRVVCFLIGHDYQLASMILDTRKVLAWEQCSRCQDSTRSVEIQHY